MSNDSKDFVTLGAQMGGNDAFEATHATILSLRRILAHRCRSLYSESIKEIALVLRIDGKLDSWGKSGVEAVFLRQKAGYATADIYVPREAWANDDPRVFRVFLASMVQEAVAKVVERFSDRGVPIAGRELLADVEAAAQEFLAQ